MLENLFSLAVLIAQGVILVVVLGIVAEIFRRRSSARDEGTDSDS